MTRKSAPVLAVGSSSEELKNPEKRRSESLPSEDSSGLVETYSRPNRSSPASHSETPAMPEARGFELSPRFAMDDADDDHDVPPPLPARDWHLPSELLEATLTPDESDDIEEQLGADVLDLYLETQQMLLDRMDRTAFPAERPANQRADEISERPSRESFDEEPGFDVVQPEPFGQVEESTREVSEQARNRAARPDSDASEARATQPGSIQRAYGKLFSELRRRHR